MMDIVNLANDMAQYNAASTQNIMMLKKAQEQVKMQGEGLIEALDASHININDGKSLDVKI